MELSQLVLRVQDEMFPTSKKRRPDQARYMGQLPVFETEFVTVMVNLGSNVKALQCTCPRADCGKTFILMSDPGKTQTRACPYCFRTSKHV